MRWNKQHPTCVYEDVSTQSARPLPLVTDPIFSESLMFKQRLLATALTTLLLASGSAFAAPADDARTHFQAVGSGDVSILMRGYGDQVQLNWIGGPLDGTYTSVDAIHGVWEKFTKSQGPLKVSIDKLEESANPKGSTVTANVQFEGKAPIKVRYVLTIRDGKIVSETWQIDPKLMLATAY